jgi:hypothetical protein
MKTTFTLPVPQQKSDLQPQPDPSHTKVEEEQGKKTRDWAHRLFSSGTEKSHPGTFKREGLALKMTRLIILV